MYRFSLFILGAIVIVGTLFASFSSFFSKKQTYNESNSNLEIAEAHYQLYDPEMAPDDIKPLVMQGFHLMLETNTLLPQFVGNKLSCTNCHFSAGNSFGGKQNGLSLVGVTHHYPKRLKSGEEYTLAERINGCFIRSMNGKPLPLQSKEMKSLVTYFEWISKDIPKLPSYPWMGIKDIRSHHKPNSINGAKVYEIHCAMCHGKNGGGQERPEDLSYPPLWGENSFNDAAGMNRIPTFAWFVYENMPYGDPGLTIEEALDVAAFVTKQPRPHFESKD